MAGIKIVDLPALGRDLISTDLLEVSLSGSGSRKITGQEIMNASKLAVGSTPIVSGTVGRLLFQGTGNVLGQSSNLFWDATNNRLGIGTSTPAQTLDARGGFNLYSSGVSPNGYYLEATSSTTTDGTLNFQRVIGGTGTTRLTFQGLEINTNTNSGENQLRGTSGQFWSILTNGSEKMRVLGNGNVLIGTTTDAGFKLDVNGTARVSSRFTIGSDIIPSAVGSSVALAAHVAAGSILDLSYYTGSQSALSTTKNVVYSAITFNPTGGTAVFNQLNFAPTINQTGGANGITRGLYVNPTLTAAADFRAIETTAGNVIFNGGNVGIGTSTPARRIDVLGSGDVITGIKTTSASGASAHVVLNDINSSFEFGMWGSTRAGYGAISSNNAYIYGGVDFAITTLSNIKFGTGPSVAERMRIVNNGNVLIGTTTDAGYKLDVNGASIYRDSLTNTSGGFLFKSTSSSNDAFWSIVSGSVYFYVSSGGYCKTTSNLVTAATGVGTINASAILQADSTTKGFLPPRMTNAQRAAIASPAVGLIVYCTDATEGLYVYKSTGWTFMV